MSDPYAWVKLIHILSATVLFGTGVGTAFQMLATHRSGRVAAIAVVSRNTVLADWLFTATTGVLQPLTGFLMIAMAGYDPFESWLIITYGLYSIAGLCWLKVVQLQYRIRRLSTAAVEASTPLHESYDRAVRIWFILGWPAFIGLILIFILMVMKPGLW